jgi:Glycosyltransferase family 87
MSVKDEGSSRSEGQRDPTDPTDRSVARPPPEPGRGWRARWAVFEERVRAGLADSAERHPRIVSAFRTIVRYRLWIIGAAALAMAIVDGRGSFEVQDPQLFIDAGKKLFSGDALNVFADETVQEGPLGLLFWGVIGYVAELVNVDPRMIAALVIYLGFTFAIVFLIRSAFRERRRPSEDLEFFVAAIVLFGGLAWTMLSTGHIAEGVIPLLWFQAAREARHGRLDRAGVLIALSAGLKLWGVLGVPILLLNPEFDWRKLIRAGAVTAAVAALLYAPFILFGDYNSLDYKWDIANSSLIHTLFPESTTFTWQMRAAQSAIVVTLGSVLALFAGGRPQADWALPLALVATKLTLDPIVFEYYGLSLGITVLLAAAVDFARAAQWQRLLPSAAIYLLVYPSWGLHGNTLGALGLVVAGLRVWLGYGRKRGMAKGFGEHGSR